MGSADSFLNALVNYDKENILPEIVKAVQPYIEDPQFTPETVITKSSAAAGKIRTLILLYITRFNFI